MRQEFWLIGLIVTEFIWAATCLISSVDLAMASLGDGCCPDTGDTQAFCLNWGGRVAGGVMFYQGVPLSGETKARCGSRAGGLTVQRALRKVELRNRFPRPSNLDY
jgi:hypothetical protein